MDYEGMKAYLNSHNHFAIHNGICVQHIEPDYARILLQVSEDSLNYSGIVHGGALYTLGDACAGVAARSAGGSYVTLSGNFNYLRPATGGVVTGEGRVVHRGRSTCVVRVQLHDEEARLLADGSFTMFQRQDQPHWHWEREP